MAKKSYLVKIEDASLKEKKAREELIVESALTVWRHFKLMDDYTNPELFQAWDPVQKLINNLSPKMKKKYYDYKLEKNGEGSRHVRMLNNT